MLNIKSIFVPPGSTAPQMNSMEAAQKNVGPTPQKPIGSGFNASKTRLFLGAAFLFLTVIGGASALYLSNISQDLRQQAAGGSYNCDGVPGCGKACGDFASEGQSYCGSTAPNSCLKCVNGVGVGADNGSCTGLPCSATSVYNTPTCGGAKVGTEACAGGANDTCAGGDCCKVCEEFSPGPGQSPQAKWVNNPGGCGGLACSKQPTPTPGGPVSSCGDIGFTPGAANCANLGTSGCFNYKTCHAGSNYDACVPNAGTNMCTYTTKTGAKCSAPCPSTVGSLGEGAARCECSNGQWTIGVLPPGGSCAQLCSCTGNTCTNCGPTKPPTEKSPTPPPPTKTPTPTPTPSPTVAPAQCTNLTMLDLEGNPITGDGDKNLKPGDAVKFMCAANGSNIAKYEFRVILPDGTVQSPENNPNLMSVGATSGNFTLPAVGTFIAQCRICVQASPTSVVCQEYEPLPGGATIIPTPSVTTTTNQTSLSCGGFAGLTCPSGYSCDAAPGVPDAMGKCVITPTKAI